MANVRTELTGVGVTCHDATRLVMTAVCGAELIVADMGVVGAGVTDVGGKYLGITSGRYNIVPAAVTASDRVLTITGVPAGGLLGGTRRSQLVLHCRPRC